jgi:ATP-dependent RNA helicase DDX54/DBP10
MHHIVEVQMSLKTVEFVVFDEADRLFEMGFREQLNEILKQMGEHRQTALFSATMPSALAAFARAGLKEPVTLRLDVESKLSPQLKCNFFTMRADEKAAALLYTLRELIPAGEQTGT